MNLFVELSLIIFIATFISIIMKVLKQPFILGYILTGILVGPYFFNILHSTENMELFSKIGITILLFIVGLHLNPSAIKDVGKVAVFGASGQILFTFIIGYLISLALGFTSIASFYVGIALSFSSTIIVLKFLSDKLDVDKLYGRISIGFLLVQDLVASTILILITAFSNPEALQSPIILILGLFLKGIILALILLVANKFIFPKLASFAATSGELLFLSSLAWGMGIASLFYLAGFSIEIGALAAGVALSTTHFATEIGSRMKPLRDFFVLLFFILLGSQMVLDTIPNLLFPATILSLFVLIGKPLIVFMLMNLFKYKAKTNIFAGFTLGQISEFSLILATLGAAVGHIDTETLSLITLVGLITIAGSTYLILYSEQLYLLVEPFLRLIEIRKVKREREKLEQFNPDVVLFGYDRVGADFVKAMQKLERPYLVVDYNPKAINKLKHQGIPCTFGDAEDIEFLQELNFKELKLVISTVPEFEVNKLLVKHAATTNPETITIVISHKVHEAVELYKSGATYVMMPHFLGAAFAARLISKNGLHKKKFEEEQEKHKEQLVKRSS